MKYEILKRDFDLEFLTPVLFLVFLISAFEGELRLGAVAPAPAVKPKSALERRAADAGNQIVSKASLGINMVKPMDTYFYAEISKFTIGAVVKAFGLDMQLPKALMETGFPDGVIVSFSASPKGMMLID